MVISYWFENIDNGNINLSKASKSDYYPVGQE
jgi:hypothetical protein